MALFAQGKNVPDKPEEEEIEGAEQLSLAIEGTEPAEKAAEGEEEKPDPTAAPEEETSAEDDIIDYE